MCVGCAIKMPSKRYPSAQMTRRFVLAPFVETTSKERRCNVMALYDVWMVISTSKRCYNEVASSCRCCMHAGVKKEKEDCCAMSDHFYMPFVQVSFVLGE